jgi:outer membrane protein insertion porin family
LPKKQEVTTVHCSASLAFPFTLLFLVVLHLSSWSDARANDLTQFLGRRVASVDVVIEGAAGSSVTEMKSLLELAAGQEYSPVKVRESLARLHQSGLISGARVEGEAVGNDGVTIRFIVKPQARVDNVVFEGETVVPAAELRARLSELDPGEKLSTSAVERGQGELLVYYTSRGYYHAEVTPDIRLDSTGTRATVVYKITPGEASRVSAYTRDVRGERIDLSSVRHALVEGQPFSQAAVQEEIDRLREAYLKQDYLAVQLNSNISADLINNAVSVTIMIDSGPRVFVGVQGLEISEDKKRKVLPFYTLGGIDDFTLQEGARRLADYAQQQGYFFAEVTAPPAPDLSGESARVYYVVEPGGRYRLKNIEIEGTEVIPHKVLQDQMKSQQAALLPLFGYGRGKTSNELLRQDANLIQKRLRELGYRRSQVEVRRGVSLEGEDLIITFAVKQGPRSFIEQVAIRGNNVLTAGELMDRLKPAPGDPLVESEVSRGADQLLAAYTALGYASAEVTAEIVDLGTSEGHDRARLVFNVTEGNRVRIRSVGTRGTAITSSARLERDFYLFRPGDWLRKDKLQETERALYDTDGFSSVNITSAPLGQTVNGVEEHAVTVNVVEAKRYQLVYGFGYQTNKSGRSVPGMDFLKGVRGLIQLTNSNMLGKLYAGSAQLRASQNELLAQLSFQNPRPLGTSYPMLISLLARRLAERTFQSDRYTSVVQFERRLSEDAFFYVGYNFERIKNILDPEFIKSEEELERNRRSIRLGRIGPSYARDTRDNFTNPTTGTFTLGSAYVATKFLGGNEQFVRMLIEHSRYYPWHRFRDTVYSVSGRLGLATPLGAAKTLPISERFFAGGARDLRGFGFEEAGPRDGTGGNAVLVINNELRFPITGILGGTVFADTGNVFRRVRDMKPTNLTQTLGFGLRIKTPVGPVRFDVAFLVINRPAGVHSWQKHLSFGQTF